MRGTEKTPRRFSLLSGFALFWLIYLVFGIVDAVAYRRLSISPFTTRVVIQLATILVTAGILWGLHRHERMSKRAYRMYFAVAVVLQFAFSAVYSAW